LGGAIYLSTISGAINTEIQCKNATASLKGKTSFLDSMNPTIKIYPEGKIDAKPSISFDSIVASFNQITQKPINKNTIPILINNISITSDKFSLHQLTIIS